MKNLPQYVKQMRVFPERSAYTFVYGGRITLAGQRSATVADLITTIGATNQLREDVTGLMLRGPSTDSMRGSPHSAASGAANAVLDDPSLQAALRTIHPAWGQTAGPSARVQQQALPVDEGASLWIVHVS